MKYNIKLISLFLCSIVHSFCEFKNNHDTENITKIKVEQDSLNPYHFIDLKRKVQKQETECLRIFYENLDKESKNKERLIGHLRLGLGGQRGCIIWRLQGKVKGDRIIYRDNKFDRISIPSKILSKYTTISEYLLNPRTILGDFSNQNCADISHDILLSFRVYQNKVLLEDKLLTESCRISQANRIKYSFTLLYELTSLISELD